MEYYSTSKKKDTLIFATTWVKLGDIMLSEKGSHRRINIALFHLYEVSKIVNLTEAKSTIVVARR